MKPRGSTSVLGTEGVVGRQLLNANKDYTESDAVWGSIWEDFPSPSHSSGKKRTRNGLGKIVYLWQTDGTGQNEP